MRNVTRWWSVGLFTIGAMLFAFAGSNSAQDKKTHEKHDGMALNQSLRDVINVGAKMFNDQGDHVGCYRLYQGSLLSVRPFLGKDFQLKIDAGMAKAEKLSSFADRAFELRRILDEVRASTKPPATKEAKKIDEKKKEDKKKEDQKRDDKKKETKKVDEKKNDEKKADDKKKDAKKAEAKSEQAQVAGKISFQGKAIHGGHSVLLVGANGKKYSSTIQKDGSFQFKTPIPFGKYGVAIEPIPGEANKASVLPPRYSTGKTSGLTIRVDSDTQNVELNLLK
jgi:outer membrane biosynthesis protein TonB